MGISSDAMINHGLMKMRQGGNDFLPNPGKFATWCRPSAEDLGLPSLESAYNEACVQAGRSPQARRYSHPAVYEASCGASFFVMRGNPKETNSRNIFKTEYDKVCQRVLGGEILTLPKDVRLEEKRPDFLTKEENREKSARFMANLGL